MKDLLELVLLLIEKVARRGEVEDLGGSSHLAVVDQTHRTVTNEMQVVVVSAARRC